MAILIVKLLETSDEFENRSLLATTISVWNQFLKVASGHVTSL